jgi:hypothetical protein
MGRKGVSKRKKAKEKDAPVSGGNFVPIGRKGEIQPEQVIEKGKASSKVKKKH